MSNQRLTASLQHHHLVHAHLHIFFIYFCRGLHIGAENVCCLLCRPIDSFAALLNTCTRSALGLRCFCSFSSFHFWVPTKCIGFLLARLLAPETLKKCTAAATTTTTGEKSQIFMGWALRVLILVLYSRLFVVFVCLFFVFCQQPDSLNSFQGRGGMC